MSSPRLRSLCDSAIDSLDEAISEIDWADNPSAFESLRNTRDYLNQMSYILEDEPEELVFD